MTGIKIAYAVTTWGVGRFFGQTMNSLPAGARVEVINTKLERWPLARAWNAAVDTLVFQEGYDAAVVMNDDVVLRQDTGWVLAHGLLVAQYELAAESRWTDRELLLLSARHAAASDACTDVADLALLEMTTSRWQPGPDFACFCVGRKLFEIVGRFDEDFVPCWHEDNDMHRRIQLAGYEAGALAPYWHFRNGTIRSDGERRAVATGGGFEQSKAHYVEKWGGYLGQETFTEPFGGRS